MISVQMHNKNKIKIIEIIEIIMFIFYSYLPSHFTVLSNEESLNEEDQLYSLHNAPEIPEPSLPGLVLPGLQS